MANPQQTKPSGFPEALVGDPNYRPNLSILFGYLGKAVPKGRAGLYLANYVLFNENVSKYLP